jgi:hypothetical protein
MQNGTNIMFPRGVFHRPLYELESSFGKPELQAVIKKSKAKIVAFLIDKKIK